MSNDKLIGRINELARKSRETELTPEEIIEQKELRAEYVGLFKRNMKNILDNITVVDEENPPS